MADFKRMSLLVAAVGLLGSTGVQASGFYQLRGSLSPGIYSNEGGGSLPNNGGQFSSDADGTILGFDIGSAMGFKLGQDKKGPTLVFDFDIEALAVDSDSDITFAQNPAANTSASADFDRTDLKLTTGVSFNVGVNVTPFVGYRYAFQGDGYFNDDLYVETGYFLGVGVSGLEWIEGWNFSGSLAYNDTTIDDSGAAPDIDATGLSAKFGARIGGTPVGVSLKYQNFDYDQGFVRSEDYLLASVTWYFMQGRM